MSENKNQEQEELRQEELAKEQVEKQADETAQMSQEEQLQEELQKEKEKFLRMFAEFENYKKRTNKERLELFATASEDVMKTILPVLDDFDRAISQVEKSEQNEYFSGILLIVNKLRDSLSAKGLKEVELSKGDTFNADLAEAVTQIPAGDEMKGKVVDVIEKGYKLGEKIIRFPKVVIGQ